MTSLRAPLRPIGALTILIATVVLLAACSTPAESGNGGDGSGGGTVAVTDGVVELSAADLAFDANVIQGQAGEAFTISFTNDDSVPHNVSVYTEDGGDEIATGDIIDPGQTAELQVPALDAGEYFFVCDLHTNMNGSVIVEG